MELSQLWQALTPSPSHTGCLVYFAIGMAVMERRDFSPVSAGLSHYREGIQQFEMSEKIRVCESRSHMEKVQQLVW